MKRYYIFTIILSTFFSHLYAYDLSYMLDKNLSQQDTNISDIQIEKPRKRSKSLYKKFENFFSDYDDDLMENMMTYSMDIMVPDEMILATKEIMNNRLDKKYGSTKEHIPKIIGTDAYNWFLTSTFYQFQDISRITHELWDEECDPGNFKYDISKEPKEPILDLKADDKNARGVTKNGIVLPINANFPDAYYPYASRPNGCSAEGLQDVYEDLNRIFDDDKWIEEACNKHDRCYYTEGSSSKECNAEFIINATDACNHISGEQTVMLMGIRNSLCGMKALTVSSIANACSEKYFKEAQKKQKAYNQWVSRYEKAYLQIKSPSLN
ncbi:MAG TPA: hypothetical protein VIN02_05185 [Sulfurovum sp.]